jgi:hypothetical protein
MRSEAWLVGYLDELIIFKYNLNLIMIQSYQNDPLLHNYLAPSYPIFIQLKSLIQALATKKSPRNIRPDLLFVTHSPRSSPPN